MPLGQRIAHMRPEGAGASAICAASLLVEAEDVLFQVEAGKIRAPAFLARIGDVRVRPATKTIWSRSLETGDASQEEGFEDPLHTAGFLLRRDSPAGPRPTNCASFRQYQNSFRY
jgi:hypothetical protein